eukprot:scaffold536_cov142-Chaetoceros_neogracile.AAC.5
MKAFEQVKGKIEKKKKQALENILVSIKTTNENEKKLKHWERELKQLRNAEKQGEDYEMSKDEDDE